MNKSQRLEDLISKAFSHTSHNREEIERSTFCMCVCCQDFFPVSEVEMYIDDDETAMCPHCGVAYVIGDASGIKMSAPLVALLNDRLFNMDSDN